MDLKLKDKVALVTGAGRNIGEQIAVTLAQEGAKVIVNDFYEDRAKAVAEKINGMGGQAIGVRADITKEAEILAMVNAGIEKFGKIDILVNNAGVAPQIGNNDDKDTTSTFAKTSREDWDLHVQINIYGAFSCTRAVLGQMVEHKYGKIINIISDAGRVGEARLVAYSAAKAGLIGFTKALAKEVGKSCINVNCVAVGATPHHSGDLLTQFKDLLVKQYPMGRGLNRLGLPSDIANAVAYFASDASEWVTGQVLSVSGGYTMVD